MATATPSYNDFKRPWKVVQLGTGGSNPFNLIKAPTPPATTPPADVLRFEGDGTTGSPGQLMKNSVTTPIGINCVYFATNTVRFDHNITGGLTYIVTLTVAPSPKPPNKDSLRCETDDSGNVAWTTQEGG